MEYAGLTGDDLANVRAFNNAWLGIRSRGKHHGEQWSPGRTERLAAAPFLLFSFQEQDEGLWQRLLNENRQSDMLDAPARDLDDFRVLQTAGLAFLWDLVRHNPYVARLVSGAPPNWCEQIASVMLMRLLECTSGCILIRPRFEDDAVIFRRLLRHGSSILREARGSAQMSAMHAMLTAGPAAHHGRLPAAACRMPPQIRQVADKV